MTTAVSICNLALTHLGAEASIVTLSPPDGSVRAQDCATFYPIARRALLEQHEWRFATRHASLATLAEENDEWGYAYSMPNLALRILAVLPAGAKQTDPSEPFAVELNASNVPVIRANIEDAKARYVVDVESTAYFSPTFELALARLLAAYLAGPIYKGSAGAKLSTEMLRIFYDIELPMAKALDASNSVSHPHDNYMPSSLAAMGYSDGNG